MMTDAVPHGQSAQGQAAGLQFAANLVRAFCARQTVCERAKGGGYHDGSAS